MTMAASFGPWHEPASDRLEQRCTGWRSSASADHLARLRRKRRQKAARMRSAPTLHSACVIMAVWSRCRLRRPRYMLVQQPRPASARLARAAWLITSPRRALELAGAQTQAVAELQQDLVSDAAGPLQPG